MRSTSLTEVPPYFWTISMGKEKGYAQKAPAEPVAHRPYEIT
jgi:hypothetical protein